ncbi:MAG: SAM-dependent methyltransferase [Hyphomicrobiales bacterium]|nr:SAM-dependent methyltransferase [Hyphomicrobiales bacterium]
MNANLSERLAQDIRQRGSIGLDEYMRAALSDEREGYYATGNPLGRDFTTAPEVSQMFGELAGLWCVDVWTRLGEPAPVSLVELGPGRGSLMLDALRAVASASPAFMSDLEVHLVETSASLQRTQARTLGGVDIPVRWHESVESLPETPMLLIANEFFDALPIRQFAYTAQGWRERRVGLAEDDAFTICLGDVAERESRLYTLVNDPAEGEIVEIRPEAERIMRFISGRLSKHSGAALLVDYGSGMRPSGDSLSALGRDGFVEALADPGAVDLSAWVDFGALARVAGDVDVFGPVPQGSFLRRLGIVERAERLRVHADETQAREISTALSRLIEPEGMGVLFKVMALVSRDLQTEPSGFLDAERFKGDA